MCSYCTCIFTAMCFILLIMLFTLQIMESPSDSVRFDPLVILIQYRLANWRWWRAKVVLSPLEVECIQQATLRNIFSPRCWLNPIKFRLHGEITFSSLGGTLLPKHLIISRFSHFVSSITTVQTSCIKPVDAASLSPFISCQLSGLQGEGTRTGSYNRPSGGWGRRGAMFVCAHKRAVLNMSHESDSGRGADPCWWPAADGIPACRFNMGHGHEGSSDPNTDPSNPTWVPFQSDPRHPLFCTM